MNEQALDSMLKVGLEQIVADQVRLLLKELPGDFARDKALVSEERIRLFLKKTLAPVVQFELTDAAAMTPAFTSKFPAYSDHARMLFSADDSYVGPVMVGAHYRGDVAVAGRRSMFATHYDSLTASLHQLWSQVPESIDSPTSHLVPNSDQLALWNELLLQAYFALFGKENTANEWVIDHLGRHLPTTEERPFLISFRIDDIAPAVTIRQLPGVPAQLIDICLHSTVADVLMPVQLVQGLAALVTKVLPSEPATYKEWKEKGDGDETGRILAYLKDIRELRERVSATAEFRSLKDNLRHRRRAAVGLLLTDPFTPLLWLSHQMHSKPSATTVSGRWDDYSKNPSEFDRTTSVLQAVLLYIRLTGGAFVTAPVYVPGSPGCSITLLGLPNMDAELVQYSRLFGFLTQFMKEVARGAVTVASQQHGVSTRSSELIIPQWKEAYKETFKRNADSLPTYFVLGQFLSVLQDLSALRHEGHPVLLTLVLGKTIDLMHATTVTHEFLDKNTRMRFQPTPDERGDDDDSPEHKKAIALVRGNFAFMQQPDAALFFAYPTDVLEVTHLIRLREPDSDAARGNRRRLVQQWTRAEEHRDAIVGICYGTGFAEVLAAGRVIGVFRKGDRRWSGSAGFDKFWTQVMNQGISKVTSSAPDSPRWDRLKRVVEAISGDVGRGSLIIIGNDAQIRRIKAEGTHLTEVFDIAEGRNVDELDDDVVFQAAIQDGAVLIDESGRLSARWQVRSVNPDGVWVLPAKGSNWVLLRDAWNTESTWAWQPKRGDWLKTLEWGTRHMAAISATLEHVQAKRRSLTNMPKVPMQGADVVSIVVSSDGPVFAFYKGRAIARFQ